MHLIPKPPALALAAIACLGASPAFGWGATGHRYIGEVAVASFPEEMPAFIRSVEAAREIGELAREPDRWRGAGEAHDGERDPAHYVDLADDLTVAGGPSLKDLPPTRLDYDTALRKVGTNQYKTGYLPYAIVDGYQQLKMDFAYWRADRAGEKFAHDAAGRDWFAKDRELHEALAIRDLGIWAHFVGDGSQPLHVSVHYDGWSDYPNPEGFSSRRGIHAHFEGAYVRENISEGDLESQLPPFSDCGCSIEQRSANYLAATQAQVVPFYRLEKARAFEMPTSEGKSFTAARLAAGAAELRDLAVQAWHESEEARVGYPPVRVRDVESGSVDALASLKGED